MAAHSYIGICANCYIIAKKECNTQISYAKVA